MDLAGLIRFLFGYFGIPIILFAAMLATTVNFGLISGSVFAAGLSLYALVFIKLMGEPVKCNFCVVIKVFIGLIVVNFILAYFTSGSTDKYDGLNTFVFSLSPILFIVTIILVVAWYFSLRFNNPLSRLLRMVFWPFRMLLRPFRKIFLKVKTYDRAYSLLKNSYNYACHRCPPKISAVNNFI